MLVISSQTPGRIQNIDPPKAFCFVYTIGISESRNGGYSFASYRHPQNHKLGSPSFTAHNRGGCHECLQKHFEIFCSFECVSLLDGAQKLTLSTIRNVTSNASVSEAEQTGEAQTQELCRCISQVLSTPMPRKCVFLRADHQHEATTTFQIPPF